MNNNDGMIYVNGDSYSTLVPDFPIWTDTLSEISGRSIVNHSIPGSSNDSIFRCTLEYATNNQVETVILATSFITREEVWEDTLEFSHTIRQHEQEIGCKFITSEFVEQKYGIHRYNKFNDLHKQLCDYYFNVYLLTRHLTSIGINYFVFSAAPTVLGGGEWDNDILLYISNLQYYKILLDDPRFLDVTDFSLVEWSIETNQNRTKTNHLLQDGHENFANHMYDTYLKELI